MLAPDAGESLTPVIQYAYDTYDVFWSNNIHHRPWHDERLLTPAYYSALNKYILERPEFNTKIYVL